MKLTKESFFENVYEVVKLIPRGRVTSYGAIAKYLGSASSSRVVGWALNNSHTSLQQIPAHRVVNKQGLLTGKHHFSDSNEMEILLESEGVVVTESKILNLNLIFWDPNTELNL